MTTVEASDVLHRRKSLDSNADDHDDSNVIIIKKREQDLWQQKRLELWSRGDINGVIDNKANVNHNDVNINSFVRSNELKFGSLARLGPVRTVRKQYIEEQCLDFECHGSRDSSSLSQPNPSLGQLLSMRGGGGGGGETYGERLEKKLKQLTLQYGPEFQQAIELNEKEHLEDCESSCQSFYCASSLSNNDTETSSTIASLASSFTSYNFGATPPEDFAGEFGFPLDLIKVSHGEPLFTPQEANEVVQTAEEEGVDKNEYKSGKYKLGGDWLVNLPKTRLWFNQKLQSTFFPLLRALFPEIVSSASMLRAHSVSLLKYNSSHPRTDVHIDNGILAMTIAMTPQDSYQGGGTYFEHMAEPIQMDAGHITVRPGSVRHGGHKVVSGTRYILGAFLLIKDRVEHVRRLKNRGSDLRKKQDLVGAAKHFEWALAINPKCTTCLKDWAEILLTEKKYTQAELKIRESLRYLENRDSDALFTLGIILSEVGKDEESIQAYTQSVAINADDAELCYNLGIKLGERGDANGEMAMYARATNVDPMFGSAWLNWGIALAEQGQLDDAEVMFLKAMTCPGSEASAMVNLSMVYLRQGENNAAQGQLLKGKELVMKAAEHIDNAKVLLDEAVAVANGINVEDEKRYIKESEPLRLKCHRLVGSILFALKDFQACEEEFRKATMSFPDVRGAWEMLLKVLALQGKDEEVAQVQEKIKQLMQG